MSGWTLSQPSAKMAMGEAEADVGIRVKVQNVFFYPHRQLYNLVVYY
jgi:hypothetical protein